MRWSVVDPAVSRGMATWEYAMASVTSLSWLLLLRVVLLSSTLVVPSTYVSQHEHGALHLPPGPVCRRPRRGQQQHHVKHVTPHAWHAIRAAASGSLPRRCVPKKLTAQHVTDHLLHCTYLLVPTRSADELKKLYQWV